MSKDPDLNPAEAAATADSSSLAAAPSPAYLVPVWVARLMGLLLLCAAVFNTARLADRVMAHGPNFDLLFDVPFKIVSLCLALLLLFSPSSWSFARMLRK